LSQLQDILKFGVDKLLENDTSSLETTDFDHMLGLTSHGQWLNAETPAETTPNSGTVSAVVSLVVNVVSCSTIACSNFKH